jgi:Na+/citrate or Na+/malate symporter
MSIILYTFIISIGYLIGRKNIFPKSLEKRLSDLQNICLIFLLGIMGYKIGSNDEIIKKFGEIGITSLIVASFSVFFSIIFVKILCKGFKDKNKTTINKENF